MSQFLAQRILLRLAQVRALALFYDGEQEDRNIAAAVVIDRANAAAFSPCPRKQSAAYGHRRSRALGRCPSGRGNHVDDQSQVVVREAEVDGILPKTRRF